MKKQESLKECYESCQFDCEFSWKQMTGNCRIVGHPNCALVQRRKEYIRERRNLHE